MSPSVHPIGSAFDLGRALRHGAAAVRAAPGPMWLGGLLASVSDGCAGELPSSLLQLPGSLPGTRDAALLSALPMPSALAAGAAPQGLDEGLWAFALAGVTLAIVLVALAIGAALFAFDAWISCGLIRLQVAVLEHASDDLAPLFSGNPRFVHMLGYKLLSGLCVSAAALVAAWPGLMLSLYAYRAQRETLWTAGIGFALIGALPAVVYVGLGVYLGEQAVVLERRPPVRALRRSFELAAGNRLTLGVFAASCWLLRLAGLLGLLLCVIGVLATAPLARAVTGFAKTEAFLLFTRGMQRAPQYALWQRQAETERSAATS